MLVSSSWLCIAEYSPKAYYYSWSFCSEKNSIKSSRGDRGIRLLKYTNVADTDHLHPQGSEIWPGTQTAVLLLVRDFLSISYTSNPVSVSIKQNLMHMPCSFITYSQITPNMHTHRQMHRAVTTNITQSAL